jgi:hypothetical protein
MKKDEGREVRAPQNEFVERVSFDDLATELADRTITRSQAIKLAGAALVGFSLTLFLPGPAGARHRRRHRRRRRRNTNIGSQANAVQGAQAGFGQANQGTFRGTFR